MESGSSLPTLLSQVVIAFTIEFDNESEQQMSKTWARPFGVSMVMWSNFMRFVKPEGTSVGELAARSCVPRNAVASVVGGMERWGYITVDHAPADGVAPVRKDFGSGRGVKADTLIRPSQVGALAIKIWEPLAGEIEDRWRSRLGETSVDNLRDALLAVQSQIGLVMPHHLPILGGGGLFAHHDLAEGVSEPDRDLAALLSRVLLAFTLDYEREWHVSLPIAANVLRVLDDQGAEVKNLPLRAGVSKEAVSMSMTWLEGAGYISVEPNPSARGKIVGLTTKGRDARHSHDERLNEVETSFENRFGDNVIGALRESLQLILGQPGGDDGPLSSGLVTPPGGWRGTGRYKPLTAAFIKSPRGALAHYPMVLHRGGWPDGS